MRRRLETQTCAPADPNLASEPRRAKHLPARCPASRRESYPRAWPRPSGTRHPAGPHHRRTCLQQTRTAAIRSETKVLTPVPDRSPPPPAIASPVNALNRYPQVTSGGRLLAPYRPFTSASVLVLACPSPISAAGATSSAS